MRKPKIGVMGFSESGGSVNQEQALVAQKKLENFIKILENTGELEIIKSNQLIDSVKIAKRETLKLLSQDVDATIFYYGIFTYPNISVVAAKYGKKPFLLFSELDGNYTASVGLISSGSALSQLGIDHFRVVGNSDQDSRAIEKVLAFSRCASVVNQLNGQRYGLIGGRCLGMYNISASIQEWMYKFGIDIEHIDQAEILRIADTIPQEVAEKAYEWMEKLFAEIKLEGIKLSKGKLLTQIKHYEAIKEIIKIYELDFVSVKCHYEMSKHYCTECLSAAFFNDPYDWNGLKETTVFACEADSDAALTMQILKLLTGDPITFMDVRHYDEVYDAVVFTNCGSFSTFYANRSREAVDNLKNVVIYPCLDLFSGGGSNLSFMARAGKVTIARLSRKLNGKYCMIIMPAEFIEVPKERMELSTKEWPHVFAKVPCDYRVLFETLNANHCHAVYGNWIDELSMICRMLDIDVEILYY